MSEKPKTAEATEKQEDIEPEMPNGIGISYEVSIGI